MRHLLLFLLLAASVTTGHAQTLPFEKYVALPLAQKTVIAQSIAILGSRGYHVTRADAELGYLTVERVYGNIRSLSTKVIHVTSTGDSVYIQSYWLITSYNLDGDMRQTPPHTDFNEGDIATVEYLLSSLLNASKTSSNSP